MYDKLKGHTKIKPMKRSITKKGAEIKIKILTQLPRGIPIHQVMLNLFMNTLVNCRILTPSIKYV